jgi:hypothetical protein
MEHFTRASLKMVQEMVLEFGDRIHMMVICTKAIMKMI